MRIHIADYDPEWPRAFEVEAKRLRAALGAIALRIDHVGSTAVPGLAAKPVIDVQVTVEDLKLVEVYRGPLEELGYTYETVPVAFFHRPAEWPHTHHVHVREAGSIEARRTLVFRDWLRRHEPDRSAYEELKRRLASGGDASTIEGRFRYSEAKTTFIRAAEARAEREGS